MQKLVFDKRTYSYYVDYKTYSNFTKELQMTAYYWILINNEIKVDNNAYIYWINKNIETKIMLNITLKCLEKWEKARINFNKWEGN